MRDQGLAFLIKNLRVIFCADIKVLVFKENGICRSFGWKREL